MLPRIVGHANALDLLLSARRVQSDEALRIGLVNRLYPADQLAEQTYAYARDLVDFVSPTAMGVIKRQLYDVPFLTLSEAMIDANREMVVAAARHRFQGRRGEFCREAAAEVWGWLRGRTAIQRLRIPAREPHDPLAFALRG
jgi:enoyl-CoA hydratase/carnithine racemase